jgi:hypothetical protein
VFPQSAHLDVAFGYHLLRLAFRTADWTKLIQRKGHLCTTRSNFSKHGCRRGSVMWLVLIVYSETIQRIHLSTDILGLH